MFDLRAQAYGTCHQSTKSNSIHLRFEISLNNIFKIIFIIFINFPVVDNDFDLTIRLIKDSSISVKNTY
jgi:hypothetical protein